MEMGFDIERIPEDLRDLFTELLPILWGKMSNGLQGEEKKKFYINGFLVEGSTVRVGLRKNW